MQRTQSYTLLDNLKNIGMEIKIHQQYQTRHEASRYKGGQCGCFVCFFLFLLSLFFLKSTSHLQM